MKATTTQGIGKTLTCVVAAAIAVSAPGLASAQLGDRAKARFQVGKTNGVTVISNLREGAHERIADVREKVEDIQLVSNGVEGARESAAEIFEQVKEMRVLEQFRQTVGMVKQMQADYEQFSGGEVCGATCARFRSSLKSIVDNFLALSLDVPALNGKRDLNENLRRMSKLIDHVPPRALYLMWQTMSGEVSELESMTVEIRQTLASLPPLMPSSGLGGSSVTKANAGGSNSGGFCDWTNQEKKPVIELVQAHLERFAWRLEKLADLIPDLQVGGNGGGTAGAAVANAFASAGANVKPTDAPKIMLKLIALIPQEINWAIKVNMLRAKVVCLKT